MKKYFMFAVVVTAGMLASCSSESLTGSDPKIETPDQADLVPIEIGVASSQTTGTTRGTGTVGGTTNETNIWKGEKVNVLMYKIASNGDPTFEFATDGASNPLYDATMTLVTPLATETAVSGLAKEINVGDPYTNPALATYKLKYYPPTGRFDFWGFYLGGGTAKPSDAVTAPTLNNVIATYDDNTTPTANNAKAVNFVLDGTMDLMVAKAATGTSAATSATNIVGDVPFTANQIAAVTAASGPGTVYASSYSAKSARGGLQPDLLFKHALTRLTFKVKAGNANAVGVKVTAIKVHSMTTGKLIVAYDYKQGNISAANSIIWDAAYHPGTDFTTDTDNDGLFDYQEEDIYPSLALKERDNTNGMQALTAYTLVAADVTNAHPIGEALLVAPQDKYWLEVEYDATAATSAEWNDPTATSGGSSISPAPITADIARTNQNDVFEAGKSYNVTISLYGPEKISITTSLEAWTNVAEEISIIGE